MKRSYPINTASIPEIFRLGASDPIIQKGENPKYILGVGLCLDARSNRICFNKLTVELPTGSSQIEGLVKKAIHFLNSASGAHSKDLNDLEGATLDTPLDFDIRKPSLLLVASGIANLTFNEPFITAKGDSIIDPNCQTPRLLNGDQVLAWYSTYDVDDPDAAKYQGGNYAHNYHMALTSQNGDKLPIIIDPVNKNTRGG